MTVYYVTIGIVGYFLVMAELTRNRIGTDPGTATASALTKFFILAASTTLVVVAGLRWRVGTDYVAYSLGYQPDIDAFLHDMTTFNEPGIEGVALLASWVYDDFATFIFMFSALTIGPTLWIIAKHSPAVAFSIALFVFAGSWHGSFNGIRQYMACAILLAGHRLIIDRKPLHFALVVLCAGLFHISALVGAAFYLVPRRRLGKVGFLGLLALSLLVLNASDAVLGFVEVVKETRITYAYATADINPLRVAVAVAPLFLYSLASPGEDPRGDWFYRNLAVVHAGVMIAMSSSAYLGRIGIYPAAFIPLYLSRLVNFSDSRVTSVARMLVLILYAAFWYISVAPQADLNHFQWVFSRGSA